MNALSKLLLPGGGDEQQNEKMVKMVLECFREVLGIILVHLSTKTRSKRALKVCQTPLKTASKCPKTMIKTIILLFYRVHCNL